MARIPFCLLVKLAVPAGEHVLVAAAGLKLTQNLAHALQIARGRIDAGKARHHGLHRKARLDQLQGADEVCDVLQGAFQRARVVHERASPCPAHDETDLLQLVQRFANGAA